MRAPIEVWRSRIFKDWAAFCFEHDFRVIRDDWRTAYEAALGHARTHHPKEAV
jgi:hypothetical protein